VAFGLGRLAVRLPQVIKLAIVGAMPEDQAIGTRDLALAMMSRFGQGGLCYRSLEVRDGTTTSLNMAIRASFSNQGVDAGAKFCLWWPDQVTADFIARRDGTPSDPSRWNLPEEGFGDPDIEMDVTTLVPLVARPPDPSDVVPVDQVAGTPIHQAFVGSCAGGRLEDIAEAAAILKDRQVATGVRLVVTPASRAVYLAALRAGHVETLVAAGAQVTDSSCGACGGIDKGLLGPGEVCVSTSNRNFRGRMGDPDAQVYLASARTAAASALTGRLTDPREVSP
jgi:3-isopropylmalate/(R)-2-methylmalate dehydratase large subunit